MRCLLLPHLSLPRLCKRRLSIIVGAGGSVEVGVPSTDRLTKTISAATQESEITLPSGQRSKQYLLELHNQLAKYYKSLNFEHLLHALEGVESLQRSWDPQTVDQYRIVESALCKEPRPEFKCFFKHRFSRPANRHASITAARST